jgi:hypothetical protein
MQSMSGGCDLALIEDFKHLQLAIVAAAAGRWEIWF